MTVSFHLVRVSVGDPHNPHRDQVPKCPILCTRSGQAELYSRAWLNSTYNTHLTLHGVIIDWSECTLPDRLLPLRKESISYLTAIYCNHEFLVSRTGIYGLPGPRNLYADISSHGRTWNYETDHGFLSVLAVSKQSQCSSGGSSRAMK